MPVGLVCESPYQVLLANQLSRPELLCPPEASLYYIVKPYLKNQYNNIIIIIIINLDIRTQSQIKGD